MMSENLRERIEDIKKIDEELGTISKREREDRAAFEERIAIERREFERKILNDRKEFEQAMHFLSERKQQLAKDFGSLVNDSVPVRLGDLIEELASLAGIATSNINISINSKSVIKAECGKTPVMEWKVSMTGMSLRHGPTIFNYSIDFESKLNDVQADGKTFLEHCTAKRVHDVSAKKYYVYLNINKNVYDLILNISLKDLIGNYYTDSWYPKDLMTQAVINCVERSQEKEVSKKRSRKLSDETKKVEVND